MMQFNSRSVTILWRVAGAPEIHDLGAAIEAAAKALKANCSR